MKKIGILGCTGSIGTQALEVVEQHPDLWTIDFLVCNSQIDLLELQIKKFSPRVVVVIDEIAAKKLRSRYMGPTQIVYGMSACISVIQESDAEIVINAISGASGLLPSIAIIESQKDIALANKETMVMAGDLICKKVEKYAVKMFPVDSEHSAIFQCLQGINKENLSRLILTASGGPFRNYTAAQLKGVSVKDCLQHPTWNMGAKITIDSSTLFNKGLEVIEAHHLFQMEYEDIDVVIHPQSVVHSMIELADGAVLAQLGIPSMKLPIQFALSYPQHIELLDKRLDFCSLGKLEFESPKITMFPALSMAYEVGKIGGDLPAVMNAANEVAVEAFLQKEIAYLEIYEVVSCVVGDWEVSHDSSLELILESDQKARRFAREKVMKLKG